MKTFSAILAIFAIFAAALSEGQAAVDVPAQVNFAAAQYTKLAATIPPTGAFISTGSPTSPTWLTTGLSSWTAGFYSGSLWMLYKLTNDAKWRQLAEANQVGVVGRQFDRDTHDVGFVIMSSYGHGLELTGNKDYENIINQAAQTLASRYFRLGGVIRSWNNGRIGMDQEMDEVKVIADNMMNLELLFKAAELTQDDYFSRVAISHAEKTMENHVREDGSTFHVVAYWEATGTVKRFYTWQGYSTASTWARGHAWVVNGMVTSYKFTRDARFLATAEKTAAYFIGALHSDFVPIWDFDSPWQTSYQPRDTSAAAIVAVALLELHGFTGKQEYFDAAENILQSLATNYRADGRPEYQIPAILVNGTVFFNEGDFNTAITYGDYYFLRALDLYRAVTL